MLIKKFINIAALQQLQQEQTNIVQTSKFMNKQGRILVFGSKTETIVV